MVFVSFAHYHRKLKKNNYLTHLFQVTSLVAEHFGFMCKGAVIRATFFFNLSRNIVALQVETLLWPTCLAANYSVVSLWNFGHINWSIVYNLRWLLLSYNLAFRRTSISTSGRHFLLNFPCQRSSLIIKLSFVSDSLAKSCIFATVLLTLLPFFLNVLKGQTRLW